MPEPPRLIAILGTRAQVIKMAPLLVELERRRISYRLLMTGQHRVTIEELLDEFGIKTVREHVYDGPEIKGIAQAGAWLARTTWKLWRTRNDWATKPKKNTIILTHGDTFTTLLAAMVGRLAGIRVAHIEAGLRSFDWRNPFPEELTRIIVTRMAHIAYCPGIWACNNLNPRRSQIVNTRANTILDALRIALRQREQQNAKDQHPYAVVSVHRFENLHSRQRMDLILSVIFELATKLKIILVLHPTTEKRLIELGRLAELQRNPAIELRPRMTYLPFLRLLSHSRLVISDGGSNQEELSFLGTPTLLMRMATERPEGLENNICLSKFDRNRIDAFIEESLDSVPRTQLPDISPSSLIADDLERAIKEN